jgi:exodeoxyribonuclease VII large subunit
MLDRRRADLRSVARALPSADALFAAKRQKLDLASAKLGPALSRNARDHENRLREASRTLARYSPASRLAAMRARLDALGPRPGDAVERVIAARTDKLRELGNRLSAARALLLRAEVIRITQRRDTVLRVAERLLPAFDGQVARKQARYVAAAQLFDSLNYKSVLARGFALVRDGDGVVLRSAAAIAEGQKLVLEFVDGTADAIGGRSARPKTGGKTKPGSTEQGALF